MQKFLIVTQKVDSGDRNLGFFISWIEEFAKHSDVLVIANEVGTHHLPPNVSVFSLGKEKGTSRISRFVQYQKLLWREIRQADGVFFHMCPEYVLAAFPLFKRAGVKSALWYVHRKVGLKLRLAEKLVDKIFTASRESFRLPSRKVEIVGHGIDTETQMNADAGDADTRGYTMEPERAFDLHLLTVGRIAPVKNVHTLILGFLELRRRFPEAKLSIVGEPITDSDHMYLQELRRIASGAVLFRGGVSYTELSRHYAAATVFVHASRTGSMDKAPLEALAAGLPVFTSSEAFGEDIPGVVKFKAGDYKELARKIQTAFESGNLGYNERARMYVQQQHNLDGLIRKILSFYEQSSV